VVEQVALSLGGKTTVRGGDANPAGVWLAAGGSL